MIDDIRTTVEEFPKWVDVHVSHLIGEVAPAFSDTFRSRNGVFSVLVHDAEEEAKALAEKFEEVISPPAEEVVFNTKQSKRYTKDAS